ncbi:hypothetical protein [uncultured Pontibacter sp.]|uniref:hypothetical protein n=1 Tax=uncultured Pontibacter sp. TaxID=453356 RepID=UPI0026391077|nr:hypothetical protein [uncultured Pontibacter sp.]
MMKIAFICGSLEPGCDGVGDYTRRLAGELIRQGHAATLIALCDIHHHKSLATSQLDYEIEVPVLRLAAKLPVKERTVLAKEWISDFDPDFISLQYVPFAFHRKGLPFGLGTQLAIIGDGRPWHIMFHELWVGMDKEAPKKHFGWGLVQQRLIKGLILKLNPSGIHTQTQLYLAQLKKIGFNAAHLPLFSNIPVVQRNGSLHAREQSMGGKKRISLVLFASIQPGAPVKSFVQEVMQYAAKYDKKVALTFIGRCGAEQKVWTELCDAVGLKFDVLGEQSPEVISEVLSSATYGIATTPLAQIEKSGVVAAMHAHGLPVLCVARPWTPRGIKDLKLPAGIIEYKEGILERCFNGSNCNIVNNDLSKVAMQFLCSLSIKEVTPPNILISKSVAI